MAATGAGDRLGPMTSRTQLPWTYGLAGFFTGVAVAVVGGAVLAIAIFIYSGGPVGDEWSCKRGEAPIVHPDGGSQCLTYGDPMPSGWTADPRGNQPLGAGQ